MKLIRPQWLENTAVAIVLQLLLVEVSQGLHFYPSRYNTGSSHLYDGGNADAYTSMGDMDWSKRNVASALRQFQLRPSHSKRYSSPAWKYSSMADADWGWKKRADDTLSATSSGSGSAQRNLYDIYKKSQMTSDYWKRYGQSYYKPYTSPFTSSSSYLRRRPYAYTSRGLTSSYPRSSPVMSSLSRSGTGSNANKNKQYSYHSMADMDWGWKRKRSDPVILEDDSNGDDQDNDAVEALDEYDLAQLIRDIERRQLQSIRDKKNLASLIRSNEKRTGDQDDEIDDTQGMPAAVAATALNPINM